MKSAAITYLVTRVHGLRTHLISQSDIQYITKAKSLKEVSDSLLKTEYGAEISKLPTKEIEATTLEEIFLRILVDRFFFISREAQGKIQDMLDAYSKRFEVENIKRVIRAKHSGETIEQQNLIPLRREHTLVNFSALIKAKDIDEAVALLRETIYQPLGDRLELYRKTGTPILLEAALDDIYFEKVWERVKKISGGKSVKDLIGEEIDLRNLMIAISLKMKELPRSQIDESFISATHKLTERRLHSLSQARLEDTRDILDGTVYSELSSEVLDLIRNNSSTPLERPFLKQLYNDASTKLKTSFLDAGYIVAYLLLSECEARNLVTVTTGKQLGLSEEDISKSLFVSQ